MAEEHSTSNHPPRHCTKCGTTKPATEFYWQRLGHCHRGEPGPSGYCKPCVKRLRSEHRENNKPRLTAATRQRSRAMRAEMLAAYGGSCSCCGESLPEFLTIDHINNDGAEHRRAIGGNGGGDMVRFLRRNGWPQDRYRLQCYNCNVGRSNYGGVCPHVRSPEWPELCKPKWKPPLEKACTVCGVTKPTTEFFLSSGRPHSYCKRCSITIRTATVTKHRRLAREGFPLTLPNLPCGLGFLRRCFRCQLWKVRGASFFKGAPQCKQCTLLFQDRKSRRYLDVVRTRLRRKARRVFEAYGAFCACCGEREMGFLTIDHIHGGGNRERHTPGMKCSSAQTVWKKGCPKDRYRVLCYNCNLSRSNAGFCPHHPSMP